MNYYELQKYLAAPEEERDELYHRFRGPGDKRLKEVIEYQPYGNEQLVNEKLINYIRERYGIKPYKCIIYYEKDTRVLSISVYMRSMEEVNEIYSHTFGCINDGGHESLCEERQKATQILLECGFSGDKIPQRGTNLCYYSCERLAVDQCYRYAMAELRDLSYQLVDPLTMDIKKSYMLFYVYRNKQMLDEAEQKGEHDAIRDRVYEIIKKYDEYGIISRDKHFGVLFLNSEEFHHHQQTDSELMAKVMYG